MNNKFDELTKDMAQSVTRRAALKKFGSGLAGMALAYFGLANKACAGKRCATDADCSSGQVCCDSVCMAGAPDWCDRAVNPCCCYCAGHGKTRYPATALPVCDPNYDSCYNTCANAGLFLGCGTFI